MTPDELQSRFAELCKEDLPRPGAGATADRHRRIFAAGREDLSLAKLAEAHWDAVAILREAGREPHAGATYAVWASEVPGDPLLLEDGLLSGTKQFCSGAGMVDRALITAGECLVEVDLLRAEPYVEVDGSGWKADAFRMTRTAAICFKRSPVEAIVGTENWYVRRTGFWRGACGPAAAWAGGAAGLLDYALSKRRGDAHSAAHLAGMHADVWAMQSFLRSAAAEFDTSREDGAPDAAMTCALTVRHLVEEACSNLLRRFGRMLGPAPLAKNEDVIRRWSELELWLRQSHAERDLEALGRALQ